MKMICEVAACGEELSEGTGSKGGPHLCPGCRTSSYYWKKQPLKAARYRFERLDLFKHRLEHYDPRVAQIINDATKSVAESRRQAKVLASAARH